MKTALLLAAALAASIPTRAFEAAPQPAALRQLRSQAGEGSDLGVVPVANPAPVASQPSAAPALPSSFSIYERLLSWTNTFDLYAPGDRLLGTLTESILSLTRTFTYYDAADNKVATAHARFLSLGSTVDVTDAQDRPVGTIKEDVLKSFFKVYTLYHVLDGSGREVATSEKTDFISTEIVLRDPSGRVVATVRRDAGANLFRLTDRWDVTISDPAAVDSRLLVVIAAYKTAVDNERRKEEREKEEEERRKQDGDNN